MGGTQKTLPNYESISIVIPSYNHGHLIARAIKSVLAQTYSNWEAIIIDNHSTDQTQEVISRFKDNRIKFMDAWVRSDYRRQGVYRKLWDRRWKYVNEKFKGYIVYAWCKDVTLSLLLEKGFEEIECSTLVEKQIQ